MEHLLKVWPRLVGRVRRSEELIVLLDYDGTLTAIAPTPRQAVLPGRTRMLLRRLNRQPGVSVGIVSGRSVRDIQRLVGLPGVRYAGNHGLELSIAGRVYTHPSTKVSRTALRRLAGRLRAALKEIPGAWVEWKGLTASLHWRAVPRRAQRKFHRLVSALTASDEARGLVRLTQGKRVIELRPPIDWDKGRAVEWIASRIFHQRFMRRPWLCFLGDDQTDEDAFRATNRAAGVSVFVGRRLRRTAARYWLKNPREVQEWLEALAGVRDAASDTGRREE